MLVGPRSWTLPYLEYPGIEYQQSQRLGSCPKLPLLSFQIKPWRDENSVEAITYTNKISRLLFEMTVVGQPLWAEPYIFQFQQRLFDVQPTAEAS